MMIKMITRRVFPLFFFLFVVIFLQGFFAARAVQAQAIVSVDSITNAKTGSTVEVAVRVTNPSGMSGFQFELEYDPRIAVVTGITEGSMLSDGSFIENLKNAASGSIRAVWFSFGEIYEDGLLCRIAFQVKSSGSTTLELKDLLLANNSANAINCNSVSGIISTGNDGTKPPPSGGTSPSKPSPEDSSSGGVSISTAPLLPYAYKGTAYGCTLLASGGEGSYTWKKVSGELPPGLVLISGEIYGTPKGVGKYEFRLRATGADGWAEKSFTLWVLDESSQAPGLQGDPIGLYSYSDAVSFKNMKISQGSMEMNVCPEKMPYTMIVDNSIDRLNLSFILHSAGDILYINNVRYNSSEIKSIPLASGTNEIVFYVQSSGKISGKYYLTIYRMPGRR